MGKEKEMTTMWVRKTQKDTIQKLKKHKNQADYEVLDELLKTYADVATGKLHLSDFELAEGVKTDG